MCELLGMSFNSNVSINFSFSGFLNRGLSNPDGWGLALYPEGGRSAQIIKEPIRLDLSSMARFLKDYNLVKSPVFISHVRYATSKVCYANTHPFLRSLQGKEYVFAHNGVLRNFKLKLNLGNWLPIGSTDSEYAFCHLMNYIESNANTWCDESFKLLEAEMKDINVLGDFNCLLSDGEYLFCYRDKNGYKGLCYTQRKAPFFEVKLLDEDLEVSFLNNKEPNEAGFIIATKPLTNEQWKDLIPGKLAIFCKGEMIYG